MEISIPIIPGEAKRMMQPTILIADDHSMTQVIFANDIMWNCCYYASYCKDCLWPKYNPQKAAVAAGPDFTEQKN